MESLVCFVVIVVAFLPNVSGARLMKKAHGVQPDFSITIKPDREVINANEEVRILFTLTNIRKETISVWREQRLDTAELTYTIDVTNEQGRPAAMTNYAHALRGEDTPGETTVVVTSGGFVYLKPGESLRESLVLNKLFDLQQPGRYVVEAQRFDEGTKMSLKSNRIVLTVTPYVGC